MIQQFQPSDRQVILDFAYEREKENMFLIGSFTIYDDPFAENSYISFFEDKKLVGVGTYFGRFGSIVINTQSIDALHAMVDEFVQQKCRIEWVPAFKRYAQPTIERLKKHGIVPKHVREETVFLLTRDHFKDHSTGQSVQATENDIDDIIRLTRAAEEEVNAPISDRDRQQIFPSYEFLVRENGTLVSKANIHAFSEHYAQIGGVVTHPAHQGKGYAKQTVSAVCKYWLDHGKDMILFCKNDNAPAIKVYRTLGFEPIDEFIIAAY